MRVGSTPHPSRPIQSIAAFSLTGQVVIERFTFCSLKIIPPSALRPRGDVTVRVAKNLTVGASSILEPYAGVAQIIVGGKTKIGRGSEVHRMAFSAPNGQFQLVTDSRFDGAVCAQKIKGNRGVQFGCPLP